MRTDPTDNGGLFIGRRPGTGPVHYRVPTAYKLGMRRVFDRLFAVLILGVMTLVSLAFWGPIPAAWLWIGAQVQDRTGSGGLAIVVSALGILLTLLAGLVLLKVLDQFWILVRRAAGYDQRKGKVETVFAVAALIGITLLVLWFLLFAGPGPELVGGRRCPRGPAARSSCPAPRRGRRTASRRRSTRSAPGAGPRTTTPGACRSSWPGRGG